MYANIFSISKTDCCNCFLIHFHLYIYPFDLQKSVGIVIHKPILKQLPDQLLQIIRYCCFREKFLFCFLLFFIDMTGLKSCLPRPPSRKSVVKCLSQGHNRLAQVEFKPRLCRSRRRCHRLKCIHSRSDTSRTGAEGLSFYYPRLLNAGIISWQWCY